MFQYYSSLYICKLKLLHFFHKRHYVMALPVRLMKAFVVVFQQVNVHNNFASASCHTCVATLPFYLLQLADYLLCVQR